jgi:hypothetical protein
MPIPKKCDYVKILSEVDVYDGAFLDWFITKEQVNNRTGEWYFGIVSVIVPDGDNITGVITDEAPCDSSGIDSATLDWDFNTTTYTMR